MEARARARPGAPGEQEPPPPEGIASVAALLLAGATAVAIADALLRLIPNIAPATSESSADAAKAALAAANLAGSTTVPETPNRGSQGRTEADPGIVEGERRTLDPDEAIYRAMYAINAARRLFAGLAAGEDFRAALEAERGYLRLHRQASERRRKSRGVTEAMRRRWGDVLSWRHGATRLPADPRPSHEAADGMNVDLGKPLPAVLIAEPGALAGCSCAWGPPVEGAETLR